MCWWVPVDVRKLVWPVRVCRLGALGEEPWPRAVLCLPLETLNCCGLHSMRMALHDVHAILYIRLLLQLSYVIPLCFEAGMTKVPGGLQHTLGVHCLFFPLHDSVCHMTLLASGCNEKTMGNPSHLSVHGCSDHI